MPRRLPNLAVHQHFDFIVLDGTAVTALAATSPDFPGPAREIRLRTVSGPRDP